MSDDVILKSWRKSGKNMRIKRCLFPGCTSDNIIKCHVFQNNGVLTQISDKGDVYMPKMRGNDMVPRITKFGRKMATVFTGFCGEHDKKVFQPIEDKNWKANSETAFLFFYRTFASQMQAKQEYVKRSDLLAKDLDRSLNKNEVVSGYMMAVDDFKRDKRLVDDYLIKHERVPINYIFWTIHQPIKFAFSGFTTPYYDFGGHEIQTVRADVNRHIFITVLPHGNEAIAIITWLKVDDRKVRGYISGLRKLTLAQRKQYLSNIAISTTDDLVLSPSIVNQLSQPQRSLIEGEYEMMHLFAEMTGITNGAKSECEEIGLNLFDF